MADPEWSYNDSSVYTDGRRTAVNPHHHTQDGTITTVLTQPMGVDPVTGQPVPVQNIRGGLSTVDAGYSPENNTLIYYVRDADLTTYPLKFVIGSQGKPKKIVTFPIGAVPGDTAQVTIFLYQADPFPTKVTSIYTYNEDVSFYIDGSNELFFDYNSANQNNIDPN